MLVESSSTNRQTPETISSRPIPVALPATMSTGIYPRFWWRKARSATYDFSLPHKWARFFSARSTPEIRPPDPTIPRFRWIPLGAWCTFIQEEGDSPMPKSSKSGRQRYVNLPHDFWDKLGVDIKKLGSGPRNMGGVQGVMMAAAAMYLAFPRYARMEIAEICAIRNLETVQRLASNNWVMRVLRAAGKLGPGSADILEAQLKKI